MTLSLSLLPSKSLPFPSVSQSVRSFSLSLPFLKRAIEVFYLFSATYSKRGKSFSLSLSRLKSYRSLLHCLRHFYRASESLNMSVQKKTRRKKSGIRGCACCANRISCSARCECARDRKCCQNNHKD